MKDAKFANSTTVILFNNQVIVFVWYPEDSQKQWFWWHEISSCHKKLYLMRTQFHSHLDGRRFFSSCSCEQILNWPFSFLKYKIESEKQFCASWCNFDSSLAPQLCSRVFHCMRFVLSRALQCERQRVCAGVHFSAPAWEREREREREPRCVKSLETESCSKTIFRPQNWMPENQKRGSVPCQCIICFTKVRETCCCVPAWMQVRVHCWLCNCQDNLGVSEPHSRCAHIASGCCRMSH